ncbi:hypothetical protein [Streptomyces sp. CAU 1734]|uniref:hypothetical protein n=1 Tax=Streptomyces sp. CAU 1734 TaxID=3140360 RepID=UPI0032615438
MPSTSSATPGSRRPRTRTAMCVSYGYTSRRGGCGLPATKLVTVTFAERRTARYRLCDRHAADVHEDVASPVFAYLRATGVTETPIGGAPHTEAADVG